MPALPPTPSGVVQLKLQHGGVDIFPGYQQAYTSGGAPTTGDLNATATGVRIAYATHLAGQLTSGLSMTQVQCIDLANPATPHGIDTTVVPGTRAGTALPLNVSAVINFQVARRYRGSKPKIFTLFGVEADQAGDRVWAGAFVTGLTAAWLAFIAALNGSTFGSVTLGPRVVVSFFHGKTINPNPNSEDRFLPTPRPTPLVQSVSQTGAALIFGSQRRRLRAL